MRLLNTSNLQVCSFIERKLEATLVSEERDAVPEYAIPKYAILSHTWEDEEVTFQDMEGDQEKAKKKKGFEKLESSCGRAKEDGYEWIWIDTCCIDKTSSSELSEAINSMFRWYKNSDVCYVILSDCYGTQPVYLNDSKITPVPSRWYSRGWTLQELIAPSNVRFYNKYWEFVGTKMEHIGEISRVTGVDIYALQGEDLSRMSVARRMTWLADRVTTRIEDIAYCMLGIFDINMPLLYGEGNKAFTRLQEEIMKVTEDQSIFAWMEHDSVDYYREDYGDSFERYGLLAESPHLFTSSKTVARFPWHRPSRPQVVSTRQGLRLQLLMCQDVSYLSGEVYLAVLDCQIGPLPGVFAGVRLRRVYGERFVRVDIPHLFQLARPTEAGHVNVEGFDPMEEQAELFDLRLRTYHKNWKPSWVFVAQSPLPQLPPAFWIVCYRDVYIHRVHPRHLWDGKTTVFQPLETSIASAKIGALEIKCDMVRVFIVFGVFVDYLGTHPWVKAILSSDNKKQLIDVFDEFQFDVAPDPSNHALRKKKELQGVVFPAQRDRVEAANLYVDVSTKTVCGTETYVLTFEDTNVYDHDVYVQK